MKTDPQNLTEKDKKRFLSKLTPQPSGCLYFEGARSRDGYGRFGVNGKNCLAHRVAYILENGFSNNELYVLHKCNNRACCNPEHLYLGDQIANMRDRRKAGAGLKITEEALRVMRRLRELGWSQRAIADVWGITQGGVCYNFKTHGG